MDKQEVIKAVQNIVDVVRNAFKRVKNEVLRIVRKVKGLNASKERPKAVASVYDYLEQKKQSEPFYKALNSNKKSWE